MTCVTFTSLSDVEIRTKTIIITIHYYWLLLLFKTIHVHSKLEWAKKEESLMWSVYRQRKPTNRPLFVAFTSNARSRGFLRQTENSLSAAYSECAV